ncbi:MAG TPA: DUF1272 domain-containing protein [Chitinophagaceae bacterium]|nr:DUF1272 domain-containing protein [Chitinophagaceae bacterium]
MLELRPICENCSRPLPFDSEEARICSFECTFCSDCAEKLLHNTCPNCDSALVQRPVRNKKYIEEFPASTNKISRPVDQQFLDEISEKQADIYTLFKSDFYSITDYRCHCRECSTSNTEYADSFSIAFIRKGHFVYNTFRNSYDVHSSRILIDKPGNEYSVTHKGFEPDACTIFSFTTEFYEEIREKYSLKNSLFFNNADIHSFLLNNKPEADYLHNEILLTLARPQVTKLEMDNKIIELVDLVMEILTQFSACNTLPDNLKKNHLTTIERAKEYLTAHFSEDISLHDLARYCLVSPFHFSRLFRQFSNYSPHQWLQSIRLKHAETLLKSSNLPVTDVCFMSGFNSLDYFSAAFSKKYKISPSRYKAQFY